MMPILKLRLIRRDEAEILARGDNHVSRESLESWLTGPQSIKNYNDLPNPYSAFRLNLSKANGHLGNAQATALSQANTEEPAGRTSNFTTRDASSAGHERMPVIKQSTHTKAFIVNCRYLSYVCSNGCVL
ncbi:unnamed protein product [Dibothriocephalus latus]|uniref:Uncharacterized protein n=1 Tax=Dibothriocephalus latus TaxID=60516 RepID=A0A3P7LLR9_DIBLA|nr:unnamed protein product [Dibothriocephalus latus]